MTKELAIIFKKIKHQNEEIEFIPIKVIEGIYSEKDNCFFDKEGTPYFHIIENPDSYGYCYRDSLINYKKNYKHLTTTLIKTLLLRTIKKYNYAYHIDGETSAPLIMFTSKKNPEENNILVDEEITTFYTDRFPEFYEKYLNQTSEEKEPKEKEEIDIHKTYETIISTIIDQDEIVQNLLSLIWKQHKGIRIANKNIIIDGPSGTGKSKICNLIIDILNIPSIEISANGGKMRQTDYLILDLAKKASGDIEKAQKGIIIIDKFEDFIMYASDEGRDVLQKLLGENKLIVSSNLGEFIFDTKDLIVIGLSNLEKIKPLRKPVTGFSRTENNNSDMLKEFSTPIKLNPLTHSSYIKILNSEEGILNQNIKLLNDHGVNLTVSEEVKDRLAQIALTSEYRVKSLEEIIERTLSVAEFEIASNPDVYSELIITPETLEDNKAYKLVRKK